MQPARKRGLREAAAWATVGALALLLLGLRLGLPVALLIVNGHSMEPTLEPEDLLVAVRATPGDVKPGDIVVWCSPSGHCTAHRLVAANTTTIVTKGDNDATNPVPDPPAPASWLRYRVVARIPRLAAAAALLAAAAAWLVTGRQRRPY
jgi:signal peptidase I